MHVSLACQPFLSFHHTYSIWSAFSILIWSTKTRTCCVLASLSFQQSPLFKTLQHSGVSSPLFCENSAQWEHSPFGSRRALYLIFGGSLKDFLSPNACVVKSSQCRVFWETIIFESIVKPHANTVRLSAFGTALFVLSRLCVKFR